MDVETRPHSLATCPSRSTNQTHAMMSKSPLADFLQQYSGVARLETDHAVSHGRKRLKLGRQRSSDSRWSSCPESPTSTTQKLPVPPHRSSLFLHEQERLLSFAKASPRMPKRRSSVEQQELDEDTLQLLESLAVSNPETKIAAPATIRVTFKRSSQGSTPHRSPAA